MATYAVSDIHGCFDELEAALGAAGFSDGDELYVLGDMFDRGTGNARMMRLLLEPPPNMHFLKGNHESMMEHALAGSWADPEPGGDYASIWLRNGGEQTLASLRRALTPEDRVALGEIVASLPNHAVADVGGRKLMLVHAGLRPPDGDVDSWTFQSEYDLLWIGREWYGSRLQPPYDVVFGHTPTQIIAKRCSGSLGTVPDDVAFEGMHNRAMHWGRRHAIDCGCAHGGRLCLLRLEDWHALYASRGGVVEGGM